MRGNLISIVVPVYNTSNYLSNCLDSLINQTYENLEIICVNDGSTDNSLDILKQYSNKDSRIKIINQSNQGVSQSRNNALKNIKGEYVLFVDSDDFIDINTCEFAINKIKEKNVDVVLWTYVREYKEKSLIKNVFEKDSIYFNEIDVYEKLYRRIFGLYKEELMRPDHGDSIVPVWGKLYKSDIINDNDIRFIDYKKVAAEDAIFNMRYFYYVKSAYYEKKYYYHYRKNDNSLTRSYNPRLIEQWNNLINYMNNEIKEKKLNDSFSSAVSNRRCLSLIPLGLNAVYKKNSAFKEVKSLLLDLRIHDALCKMDIKYLPLIWKVFFLSAKYKLSVIHYLLIKIISFIVHN